MIKKILLPVLVSMAVTGCMVKPDQDKMGPYPYNYEFIVKNYIENAYFDPYSLRRVSLSMPLQGNLFFQQGWLVCLKANAKNRMGGYAGFKANALLINRGKVVQTMKEASLCKKPKIIYYAWPEMDAGK